MGSFFLVGCACLAFLQRCLADPPTKNRFRHVNRFCRQCLSIFDTMILPDEAHSQDPANPTLLHRRGVLSTLGLTGVGFLATSAVSSGFTFKKSSATPKVSVPTSSGNSGHQAMRFTPLSGLPEAWSANNGSAAEYLRYLNSLNLRLVDPKQVIEIHAKSKGPVWNSLPPKAWWNRMGYVLKVVDRIGREMGVSEVDVISAYRSPAYNARCPGAKSGSWHQANVAVDVKFPVRPSSVASTARELRDLGLFKGGVGSYRNFTHIDARGKNTNW